MVLNAFIVSTSLLVGVIGLLVYERRREVRYASSFRTWLDFATTRSKELVSHGVRNTLQYIERNILLKGLHMITYVALVQVRFLERKLVQVSHRIRTFHRDHHVLRRSTHRFAKWTTKSADDEAVEKDNHA